MIALVFFVPLVVQAQTPSYQCPTGNGVTIIQDHPCAAVNAEASRQGTMPPGSQQNLAAPHPPITDWSGPVDFKKMREEYGALNQFDELCDDRDLTKKMVVAMNSHNDEDILKYTQIRLAVCPVDIGAHVYLGTALQRQGKQAEMAAHFQWAFGLLKTILASGDGKTSATAFKVISIAEEKQVLGYFQLRMTKQTLETNPYRDRLDAVDAHGISHVIYFNPEAHFLRLRDKLNIKIDLGDGGQTK